MQVGNPDTYASPDGRCEGTDAKECPVQIAWWKQVPVKEARWLDMTVIRVVHPHATNKKRDPRESCCVWLGDLQADIARIAISYALRFGQEHGYCFDKHELLWEQPRLRTPELFERWSQIVAIAHNHLVQTRDLVEAQVRPWESKHRPASLQQVRRGLGKLLPQLGTPAHSPKPCGKSKGKSKRAKVPQIVPS